MIITFTLLEIFLRSKDNAISAALHQQVGCWHSICLTWVFDYGCAIFNYTKKLDCRGAACCARTRDGGPSKRGPYGPIFIAKPLSSLLERDKSRPCNLFRGSSLFIAAVTTSLSNMALAECLDILADAGIVGVEISAGGFRGAAHIDPTKLLGGKGAREMFLSEFSRRSLKLAALAYHGNTLHPDSNIRETHRRDFERAVKLAPLLGVETVVCLSGCPGADVQAHHPTWVASAWPDEMRGIVKWQWEEVALPYWEEAARFASEHGVRLAMEMHPSNLVYNPATLNKLRRAVGNRIGVNVDPSHLFWQGINPASAVLELGDAVFHVHIKDVIVDSAAMAVNGCLDGATVLEGAPRTWRFGVVGEGHDEQFWVQFFKSLKEIGYNGPLAIEHESRVADPVGGIRQGMKYVKNILSRV